MNTLKKTAFVIRPFDKKKDSSGKELDFERVHHELIEPALAAAGLEGATTGQIVEAGNIREDMFAQILEADLVVCDVTIHNANVFYELGIRHALRKNRTVMICGKPTADRTPFDLLTDRYQAYDVAHPAAARDALAAAIRATLDADRADSPVFQMLPALPPANPAAVQPVPVDFREEVDRARAARSSGWLRLLAEEVGSQRFRWPGLQLVARTQWSVEDYEGARDSLNAIRAYQPDSAAANLAVANVCERLHRQAAERGLRRPELLVESDQAIERVLASEDARAQDRVEALALEGRNAKTRWRLAFEELDSLDARRRAAMSQALRDSYQAYRAAFDQDLNHFYSGLGALQMGAIFLGLSADGDAWRDAFPSNDEADAYRERMRKELENLKLLVGGSVEAALRRMAPSDPDRVWAQVSAADLTFLADSGADRVVRRYQDAVQTGDSFVLNAVRRQVRLFACLGIKSDLADRVLAALPPGASPASEPPLRVVLFAGHRVDEPGRAPPRFPGEREARAAQLLREKLTALGKGGRLLGLASAAPGADILFHETCKSLGIPSVLCLPVRASQYGSLAFQSLDDWRSRFLQLRDQCEVLELGDFADDTVLPRWLRHDHTDAWERGNRWVLHMAMAKTPKVTLLALWDGKPQGAAPGGTAHMVELARAAGSVDVNVISTARLLE